MSVPLPDPLGFVLEALSAEGALYEREGGDERVVALVPPSLAERLGVAEECELSLHAERAEDVFAGLGSPLLERLIAEARARCPATSMRLSVDPPRPSHVRSVAERFLLRNGLAEPGQVTLRSARYAVAWVAYVVEADDRREGLVRVVTSERGEEPDEEVAERLDPGSVDVIAEGDAEAFRIDDLSRWVGVRAEGAVRAAASPRVSEVWRRQKRDHERIASYFEALIAEAKAPRRRVEPEALRAKVEKLFAERDKKLLDLRERFAVRVRAEIAAVAAAEIAAAEVSVRLRRRKQEREITLRVPSGARSADKLACEGCGAATGRPAACDERMHLLCERCAPSAEGRLACPACKRRG